MASGELVRLLRRKEVQAAVESLIAALPEPLLVLGPDGARLAGDPAARGGPRVPVAIGDEEIGGVQGASAAAVAAVLVQLAVRERDKRSLARETLDRYKEIGLLYEVTERLTSCLDPEEIARIVLEEAGRMLPGTGGAVLVLERKSRLLQVLASRGHELARVGALAPDKGIVGRVFQSGQLEVIEDVDADPAYERFHPEVRAVLCAPLRGARGTIGVLRLTRDRPVSWTAGELKLITSLAAQAASAVDNARLHEERMRHQQLRSHLERYVSPVLLPAALGGREDRDLEVAVLFSDLRQVGGVADASAALDARSVLAIEIVLSHQGVANRVAGDMLVALFVDEAGGEAARRAVAAARRLTAVLGARVEHGGAPGVGVSARSLAARGPQDLREPVACAAVLQGTAAGGQVKVDAGVRAALAAEQGFREGAAVSLGGRVVETFEVIP